MAHHYLGYCVLPLLDTDVREGFIIEDMAVPSCFAEIVNIAFARSVCCRVPTSA